MDAGHVPDTAGGESANPTDEFAWVRPMQDARKEQDLGFERGVFETAIGGRPSDPQRTFHKQRVHDTVRTGRAADGGRNGRIVRAVLPKPGYRRVRPALVPRLELLGLVQESVRGLNRPPRS